jgi:phospholipase/carboxylesterase
MALHTGLRHRERLAGVMALSCYLPLSGSFSSEAATENRDVPIFMAHGTEDGVVPYEMAAVSRDLLLKQSYAVEWHEYPMAHSVCIPEIEHIGAWLRRVLMH